MYDQLTKNVKIAYGFKVDEREARELVPLKVAEREKFLALLQTEDKHNLLEIAAGTGIHGWFFQDNGLDVICTDLSPKMIASCREKGLYANEMDFLNLDFPTGSLHSKTLLLIPHR